MNIAANGRLQLNGATGSKIVSTALNIAGTPAAPTGTLDVGNSGIALDYPTAGPSPAADVRTRIIAGRGAPGLIGTWDGKGITSSASQAAPDATVELGGRRYPVHAREVAGDERDRLYARFEAASSQYRGYRETATRTIPVIVLEPRGGGPT